MTEPTTEAGRTFLGALETMDRLDPCQPPPVDWAHGIVAIEDEARLMFEDEVRAALGGGPADLADGRTTWHIGETRGNDLAAIRLRDRFYGPVRGDRTADGGIVIANGMDEPAPSDRRYLLRLLDGLRDEPNCATCVHPMHAYRELCGVEGDHWALGCPCTERWPL